MRAFLILTVSAAALAVGGAAASAPPAAEPAHRARLDPAERDARKHEAFERLDADHNGSISYSEFAAPHHRAPRDPGAPRRARGTGAAARRGSALDADGDGVVTREEYMAAMARRFDRMDTDHDGRLSLDERRPGRRRAPLAPAAGN